MRNLLTLALLFICYSAMSQEPSTTWPYQYKDFSDSKIYFKDNSIKTTKSNIHLLKSKIHYLEGDDIMEMKNNDVVILEINGDKYMNIYGSMMKIVASNSDGLVARKSIIDFSQLNQATGAYGTSTNSSSTMKLNSVDVSIAGIGNVSHSDIYKSKEDGKALSLVYEYYLVTNGFIYKADKKNFESQLPIDKRDKYLVFVKKNKIKWSEPESLIKILNCLN